MRDELHFDAIVIGAGCAGLVAGTRLAQGGARVCVLAKGIGSTHLAPGTVDVLGYNPERVEQPGRALEELIAARPDHPYALLGGELVGEAIQWFKAVAAAGPLPGYRYVGDLERNHQLPTAVGALRPSAVVPETMAGGDARDLRRVYIAGVGPMRDFHPGLCAANLRRAGIDARAITVEAELERADANTLAIARSFDDPAWRARFCAQLSLALRNEEHVGLPAALGLRDPHGAWSDLERRLGRRVFEIPTLPPSVPGMRLFEILRLALRSAGGRLVLGSEVLEGEREGERVRAVRAQAAGRQVRYAAPWIVLATGGFSSGAVELDSRWVTHERVLGLPLREVPAEGDPRFGAEYFGEQPLARAGVAVDGEMRAEGAENVVVVGASLPGAIAWREGCGEGVAITSGFRAAQLISSQSTTAATIG